MIASVVVPLCAHPGAALRCLSALAAVPEDIAFEVVVVDDATVGLEGLLGGLGGDVAVVRLDRPEGLAGALRAGIARASAPHVVVLGGAAEVEPGFLAALLAGLAEHPAVAAGPAAHAVAAHALAWRAADASPAVPDLPDQLVLPALAASLPGDVPVRADAVVHPPSPRGGASLPEPGGAPELSIVIPTLDATSDRARGCIRALQACTDVPHEIIVVDNGAPPQGFSAPVNAGLRAARGAYAVVCNDDVEVLPGWWSPLRDALDAGHPVAFPLTIDGAMRTDFAAWCFAVSRQTLDTHGEAAGEFLHPELRVWYQDTLLLERLRALGTPPRFVPESRIRHGLSQTVGTTDPALRVWIDAQIQRDRGRFSEVVSSPVTPGR